MLSSEKLRVHNLSEMTIPQAKQIKYGTDKCYAPEDGE